ncbi:MAG: trimethylamine methyltransferase family protein, partial [Desulfobacterales bacterium]|nr:trimethylamine methyltransferase family protein [Desulfobacterales bacterium]
ARHLMQGFDLTRESMGLDAMDRVGIKGNFLGDPHTFEYLRKEVKYTPGIFQWTDHGKWSDDGRPSLLDRARDKAAAILKDHRPEPLDPGVQKEIRQLLDSADRELDPS